MNIMYKCVIHDNTKKIKSNLPFGSLVSLGLLTVTDLRIAHGLGTRAFRGPAQILPLTTHY